MPRKSKYPRLRVHVRHGRSGQVWTNYYYDMRPAGEKDISLGSDYETALTKWRELHETKPRLAGTIAEAMNAWEADVLPTYDNVRTRKGYAGSLKFIRPVFGPATWESIEFVHLKAYLKKRTAKTQGNRELALLSVIWNWARGEGLTTLPWPAAGMERSRWKNPEKARVFEVTDHLFDAVYAEADQTLRDAMDLSTATGMRLTDCREVLLPRDGVLHLDASKTSKRAGFDVELSAVLPDLVERRRAKKADHLMLLTSPTGKPLSERMLRDRYDVARAAAAAKARKEGDEEFAQEIEAMWLRDMRKRAADLATDDDEASKLLQHSSVALTKKHYRTRVTKLKPVR